MTWARVTAGRAPIPFHRLGVVPRYAMALFVTDPKIVLGRRVTLLGRAAPPLNCLGVVLRHAPVFVVHDPKIVLGRRVTLLGRAAQPFSRLSVVLRHASAFVVHEPKKLLGLRVTLLGQRLPEAKGGRKVAPSRRREPVLVRPRVRCTRPQRKEKRDDKVQASHDDVPFPTGYHETRGVLA